MQISAEEDLMYRVMKAIYDSGIPIDFKGSMVLKACLLEAGYNEEIRHTVDIDANWYSDCPPTTEQIAGSLQKALKRANIDLDVNLYRMYGEGRSAGFEISDNVSGEILFTIDIDVNRPALLTKIYEISEIHFRGATANQMLTDKIFVISGNKIFMRVKDVVDLYYLSRVFPFNGDEVKQILRKNGKELGTFDGFLYRKNELKHAYDKFRFSGDVNKPLFNDVYDAVKFYINDFLPE